MKNLLYLKKSVVAVGESSDAYFPLRADITVYDDDAPLEVKFEEVINFLGFSAVSESYNYEIFNVENCFQLPQERDYLKITFNG